MTSDEKFDELMREEVWLTNITEEEMMGKKKKRKEKSQPVEQPKKGGKKGKKKGK